MVILLVVRMTENTHRVVSASRARWLVGPGVPECSNCREPRGGDIFSDDGAVYLCPKCVAFHEEYMTIMAKIETEQEASGDQDAPKDGVTV
jgi:hypothetical protein